MALYALAIALGAAAALEVYTFPSGSGVADSMMCMASELALLTPTALVFGLLGSVLSRAFYVQVLDDGTL